MMDESKALAALDSASKEVGPDWYYIPDEYDGQVLEPNYFCRARNTKRMKWCRARSGQGTDHLGQGRCKMHGGAVPIKSGRYSDIKRSNVQEHFEMLSQEEEDKQQDIMPEVNMLRAIAANWLEDYDVFVSGIKAYNDDELQKAIEDERGPRFLRVPEIHEVSKLFKDAADLVLKLKQIQLNNSVAVPEFIRLMNAMGDIVSAEVRKVCKGRLPEDDIDGLLADIAAQWREKVKVK